MYCSHCGKKVGDAMLFCPFCGEPIVIPEQDEPEIPTPLPEDQPGEAPAAAGSDAPDEETPTQPLPRHGADADGFDVGDPEDAARELLKWNMERDAGADDAWARRATEDESFSPLVLDDGEEEEKDWKEEIRQKKQAAVQEKKAPEMQRTDPDPVRLEGAAPKLELDVKDKRKGSVRKPPHKHANTLVPPKTMDPNDIFMASRGRDYDDDFDPYDDADDDPTAAFSFVDEDEDSFFMRHLRGIVGFALFVILLLLFVIYAFSKAGQISLARANLAWSTEAYVTLGNQSYQNGDTAQAAQSYERALQRDPGNYGYASSAAMAYFEAGNTEKTAEMLKKCVEIDPTQLDPYIYLLNMYPDAASRPWDVTQLLQQGYRNTGDSRLNVTG